MSSYHEGLSQDYASNSLKDILRFGVIGGNILIFYFASGLRRDGIFGPYIDQNVPYRPFNLVSTETEAYYDPLEYYSTLDCIALLLCVLLIMQQFASGRPEIDSFKESIYLPAEEKKIAILLTVFCVFKMWWQCTMYLPLGYARISQEKGNQSQLMTDSIGKVEQAVKERSAFMFSKAKDGLKDTFTDPFYSNLILLISSALCVASAFTFRLELKHAEKQLSLRIVNLMSQLSKVALLFIMIYIIFIQDNKCLALIYLLILVFDVARIVPKLMQLKKGDKLEIDYYISSLKWTSYIILTLILFGPFFYGLLRQEVASKKSTILFPFGFEKEGPPNWDNYKKYFNLMDYVMLYFQKDEIILRTDAVIVIIALIGVISILNYSTKVHNAASLDIFDTLIVDKLETNNNKKAAFDSGLATNNKDLPKDSLTLTKFFGNFFSILKLNDNQIFTSTYDFQPEFVKTLAAQSHEVNIVFEKIKSDYHHTLNRRNGILANTFQFIKWVRGFILLQIVLHVEPILRLTINIYSMESFLFFVQKPGFTCTMVYTLLLWNILSMVSKSNQVMLWATIILVYPFYLIDYGQTIYMKLDQNLTTRDAIMAPFTVTSSFLIVLLTSVHLGICVISEVDEKGVSKYNKMVEELFKKGDTSENEEKYVELYRSLIVMFNEKLDVVYRYIPIMLAIITALYSISIMNAILLMVALKFMWNSDYDKNGWAYFNGLAIVLLIVKQIGNYALSMEEYNIEYLALAGFVSIEEQTVNNTKTRGLMVFNFILVFFTCGWYKRLNNSNTKDVKKVEAKQDELEKQMEMLEEFELVKFSRTLYYFFSTLFQYYSVWIYHICANLILLNDTRDFLCVVLILCESLIVLLHIVLWNRSGPRPYRAIYKSWKFSFYLVAFYAICRYMLFFLKYTVVQYWYRSWTKDIKSVDMDRHVLKSVKSIDENQLQSVSVFISIYSRPLLLLMVGVFARENFKTRLRHLREEQESNEATMSGIGAGLALALADDKERQEILNSDVDGEKSSTGSRKSIVVDTNSPSRGRVKTFIQSFKNAHLMKSDGKVFMDLSTISRQTNPFLVMYLTFKGLFLALVIQYFHVHMNIFKVIMILCYLLNMRSLFSDMIQICERMKLMEIFTLRAKYFFLTFLAGKKWKNVSEAENTFTESYTEEVMRKDLLQNKIYYQQFLVRMEKVMVSANKAFWGITFFPLLVLFLAVVFMNYFLQDVTLVEQYRLDLFVGLTREKWLNEGEVIKELFGIQMVLTGLFVEFVMICYYLDCHKTLSDLSEEETDNLLKHTISKLEFYIDLRNGKIDPKPENKIEGKADPKIDPSKIVEHKINLYVEAVMATPELPENAPPKKRVGKNGLPDDNENLMIKVGDMDEGGEAVSEEEESSEEVKKDAEQVDGDVDYFKNVISNLNSDIHLPSVYLISESLTKENMLLFLFKNKYKYYLAKTMEGAIYAFTRLALIPLVLPLTRSINFLTVGFYIAFLYQSFQPSRTFFSDVYQKNTIILIFLFSMCMHEFLHKSYMEQSQGTYRQFFEGDSLSQIKHLLKPIQGEKYYLCFYWLFVNSLGFAIIPIFVWLTSKALFRQKLKKRNLYHFYLYDQQRKMNVIIDYKKWRSSSLQLLNPMFKSLYINSVELHTTVIMICLMFFWKNFYLALFLYTLGISAYENFRSSQDEDTKANREFFLKWVMRIFIFLYWAMIFAFHVLELLARCGFSKDFILDKESYLSRYDSGTVIILLMCFSGIFEDLVLSTDYYDLYIKLKQETDLKIKYASVCMAYDSNEKKIYRRVVEMMRKRVVDAISTQILTSAQNPSMFIDTQYMEKSVIDMIDTSADKVMEKHMSFVRRYWIWTMNVLYGYLLNKSNGYRNQDMLFLYNNVRLRNPQVLQKQEINLEDYFDHDFKMFHYAFQEISVFYYGLADGQTKFLETYEQRVADFLAKDFKANLNAEVVDAKKKRGLPAPLQTPLLPKKKSKAVMKRLESKRIVDANKKSPELLKAAGEDIADYLKTRYDKESKTQLENYKIEFNRCGSLSCVYGKMKVILYNIRNDDIVGTMGYSAFKLTTILKYSWGTINSNTEYLVSTALIIIHILYGGFFNILLVGMIVFTIFIEESTGRTFWWRALYSCYFFVMLFKQSYTISSYLQANPKFVVFFFGDMNPWSDILCILLVMYMIRFLKKNSVNNRAPIDFENPGLAVARLSINDDFNGLVDRMCNDEIRKKEQMNIYFSSQSDFFSKSIGARDFKLIMIKLVIRNYTLLENFKKEFLHTCQLFLRLSKYDLLKMNMNDIMNFSFRNFSSYMRKSGKNYTGFSSLILLSTIAYVLLFFPTMSYDKTQIASFVTQNKVTAFTVINFAVYLTFFLLNYYIDQMKCSDTRGLVTREYNLQLMSNFDVVKTSKTSLGEKVRAGLRKAINLMLLRKPTTSSLDREDYKENPLYYLFMFSIFLWVYLNFTTFFWHTYNMNVKASSKEGLFKFICEETDKEGDLALNNQQPCLSYLENWHSKIFYSLNVLYIVLCMYQIRNGKIIHESKIKNLEKPLVKNLYTISAALPLVRETKMAFEYCATKTSLLFGDFTLLKEIEFLLHDAKIGHIARMNTQTGKTQSRVTQIGICTVFMFILLILMVLPLYIFYQNTNKIFFPINSATLSIDLYAGPQKITNLFYSSNLLTNEPLINKSPEMVNTLLSEQQLKIYDRDQFIDLTFNKFSDSFPMFTPRLLSDLQSMISISNDINVKLTLNITTEAKDPVTTAIDTIKIDDLNKNQFMAMLNSGCEQTGQSSRTSIDTELFLTVKPSVILLEKAAATYISAQSAPAVRFSLALKCSYERRNYIWISEEKAGLEFFVITKPRANLGFISAQNFDFLNIQQLYALIVVYIGFNFLRSLFFGQTPKIWYTNIPSPDKIIVILDALEYARLEGDLVREEMLYFAIVDIMRNPEQFRAITQNIFTDREELLHKGMSQAKM
jgi:hypothetical protein